jgi:hypothetical protein
MLKAGRISIPDDDEGFETGKGGSHMAGKLSKLARFAGLEVTAEDKAIRQGLIQRIKMEAARSMEDEQYNYDDAARQFDEAAKAYEDAHFEEDEGAEPPNLSMRKMSAKFRRLAKLAKSTEPEGDKPNDEEGKDAMQSMARRLGLAPTATPRQISLAMEGRTVSLDQVGKLEQRIQEMERQRETEVREERKRSALMAFDQAVALGRTKEEKREAYLGAYERNPADADALLFASGTFPSRELLLSNRMTAAGAPIGVAARSSSTLMGPDARIVSMSAFGGSSALLVRENLASACRTLADSDDVALRSKVDKELTPGVKGTKYESFERYAAAERIVRREQPALAQAASDEAISRI